MMSRAPRVSGTALLAFAALGALRDSARGQTACQGSAGPDIVVSDITGPVNYPANGTLEALMIGTTSCNQGTAWLNFFASTNQHPVFGGALYRWKTVDGADRFEQVGQSWLRHGFFALSMNLCCPSCQATDGAHLGVECSDSSSASAAGTQSALGPRWQVDAFSGAFTYPPANPPFSGTTARRLQVDIADLEPTGGAGAARYFAEVAYVAPDDAAAGNRDNNASWREMLVTGGGAAWTLTFSGSTQREQPAIRAWSALDPAVRSVDARVPGEGLLILAWKVSPLPGGTWRYEYALENLNSDLSCGSFSLPVPAGASVSNVGFHDVDYRDGDGIGSVSFDGSDWPGVLAGGALTWATTPFATDPNANALRWGTTYNFRFDADQPPGPGLATIGLFKSAGQLAVAVEVPAGPSPGAVFCRGDGADPSVTTPCPCANFGALGHGCANSQPGSQGALLASAGATSPDSVVLTASEILPAALCIFLQGSAVVAGGTTFGDGVRCAGGLLKRLGTKAAIGGVAMYPQAGDLTITARSASLGDPIPAGATRHYQVYYRDPDASFCPSPAGGTFDVTNGESILW